ncbi:hypothetical protein ACWE42_12545 [Sutcliffiella cohnii]
MGHFYHARDAAFEEFYAEKCGFKKNKKKDCICSTICDYLGETVTIRTNAGFVFNNVLVEDFNARTGCVYLVAAGPPATSTVISCHDIENITQVIPTPAPAPVPAP